MLGLSRHPAECEGDTLGDEPHPRTLGQLCPEAAGGSALARAFGGIIVGRPVADGGRVGVSGLRPIDVQGMRH